MMRNAAQNGSPPSSPQLREWFERLIDLPSDERKAALARADLPADELSHLRALLHADDSTRSPFDIPAADWAAQLGDAPDFADSATLVGQHVGAYRLAALIGEGGSSAVFRAERDLDGVRQVVALKLLRTGLFSDSAQHRFRRERAILMQLSHPDIARLIDGGVSAAGIPYIAMELVDGVPLTDYADRAGLDQTARLKLLADLCRTIDAAHRALVVHRDLKPSNVLVDAQGRAKVLDFGIAKLLDTGEPATATQHIALTPGYAAPEQYRSGVVTTAVDVYSLGVIAGELLLGARLEPDATPPADATDAQREAIRQRLRRLDPDLANMLRSALATEPEYRYASARHFADDIGRWLRHEPITAHPPSRWYRARKFVARHRGGVAVTGLFLVAILASLGLALWQADVARRQADLARHQAARANAVRDFVEQLFAPLRYGVARDKQPSLANLLDAGVVRLDSSPQLGAGERVDLLAMFSRLYENLGDLKRSRELASRAMALSERTLPPSDLNAIRALTARGYAAVRMEDYAAGGADLREAHRRMLAEHIHGETLIDLLGPLGTVEGVQGHGEASLALAREALAERIATWGPDDPRVGIGYNDLASILEGQERYDEAAAMWQRTYRFQLAHQGPYSNETALALQGWASASFRAGHWTVANDLFDRSLAMFKRNAGRPQVTTVYGAQKACFLSSLRADRAGADARCGLARQLSASGFGAGSALHGDSLEATAFGDIEFGDLAKARDELLDAKKLYGSAAENRLRNGRADSELAGIALLEGDPATARRLLPGAIAGLRTRSYKVLPLLAEARLLLACDAASGPECRTDLAATVAHHLAEVSGRSDPMLLRVQIILARLELEHGDPAATRSRLAAAIARVDDELPPAHPRLLEAQLWLSLAAAREGDCAAAAAEAGRVGVVIAANNQDAHPLLAAARKALRDAGWCGPLID